METSRWYRATRLLLAVAVAVVVHRDRVGQLPADQQTLLSPGAIVVRVPGASAASRALRILRTRTVDKLTVGSHPRNGPDLLVRQRPHILGQPISRAS